MKAGRKNNSMHSSSMFLMIIGLNLREWKGKRNARFYTFMNSNQNPGTSDFCVLVTARIITYEISAES